MCALDVLLSTETTTMNIVAMVSAESFGGASIASTEGACSTEAEHSVVVAIDLPSNTLCMWVFNF